MKTQDLMGLDLFAGMQSVKNGFCQGLGHYNLHGLCCL